MNKGKNYYLSLGMSMGTTLSAGIFITIFAISKNPVFLAFIGIGPAIGLSVGAGLYQNKEKSDKKNFD